MDKPQLTDRQSQVLQAIAVSIADKGKQPTYRELCKQLGILSPNGISCHIRALEKKGYLTRKPGESGLVFKDWRDHAR